MLVNTFRLIKPVQPGGITIHDCYVHENGKRKLLRLQKYGDMVPIDLVDIPSFVKSSYSGVLRELFLRQTLGADQVEVDMKVYQEIQHQLDKMQVGKDYGIYRQEVETKVLEPGCQVAIGNFPEDNAPAFVMPQTQVTPQPNMIEQGMGAGVDVETAEEKAKQEKARKAKEVDDSWLTASPEQPDKAAENSAGSPYARWKNNLSFADQKRVITESQDVALLTWISENDDSTGLKRLAKVRLEELKAVKS